MEKISVKKDIIKNSVSESAPKQNSISQTEKILVENFVSLQKVMVNLSEKFTNLSSQISKLLELFESSAKTLAEKGFEDNKEIINKLDSLLDQNRIIAKGIFLLHEEVEEENEMPTEQRHLMIPKPIQMPKQIPMQNPQMPTIQQNPPMQRQQVQQSQNQGQVPSEMQGYQKSISSP